MEKGEGAVTPPGNTQPEGGSAATLNLEDAAPQYVLDAVEAYQKEANETTKKSLGDSLARAKAANAEKAKQAKLADEAAKIIPDYSKMKMPEGTKLHKDEFTQLVAFAKESKLPLETAQTLLEDRHQVVSRHIERVAADVKAHQDKSLADLTKDWGKDFDTKVGQAKKAVEKLDKALESKGIPGLAKAVTEMGLDNSRHANHLFHYLFEALKMGDDTIERGNGGGNNGAGSGNKKLSNEERGAKLFPGFAGAGAPKK